MPLPIPSDLIMIAAGVQAAAGSYSPIALLLAVEVAVVVGSSAQFLLVRGAGRRLFSRFGRFVGLTPARLDQATATLRARGPLAVFFGLNLPGARAGIIVAAGLSYRAAAPAMIAGSSVYHGWHVALGYAVGPAALALLVRAVVFGRAAAGPAAPFGCCAWPVACYPAGVAESPAAQGGLTARASARRRPAQLLVATLTLALLWAPIPQASAARAPTPPPATVAGREPIVDGVPLETTSAAGTPLHHDREVPPAVVGQVAAGLEQALVDVPRVTGLDPPRTPLAVLLLADEPRLRRALVELAGVPVERLRKELGGYVVERGGTMLIFFEQGEVRSPLGTAVDLAHELVHVLVREASARRPVPQWFNEGYATWMSLAAIRERYPEEAAALWGVVRAGVASGLHARGGLLPWAGLVSREQFSRADREGFGAMAYGQGALFVEWLAARHGTGAPAAFLRDIGRGASPTAAFTAAFGPFAPEGAAFAEAVAGLPAEFGPGLHVLSARVDAGRAAFLAIVGGIPEEVAVVEIAVDGEPVERRELPLDAVGFRIVRLDEATTARPGRWEVRAASTAWGHAEAWLEVEPPAPSGPAPLRVPVQIPSRRAA